MNREEKEAVQKRDELALEIAHNHSRVPGTTVYVVTGTDTGKHGLMSATQGENPRPGAKFELRSTGSTLADLGFKSIKEFAEAFGAENLRPTIVVYLSSRRDEWSEGPIVLAYRRKPVGDGIEPWDWEKMGGRSEFAIRLQFLREKFPLSIAQLAEAAGMTRQAVDLLERGDRQPTLETAERLATALGKKLRVFEGCGITTE